MIIRKDQIILLSSGEYSDYNVHGLGKALVDFNVSDLRDDYLKEFPEQIFKYRFKEYEFITWLKAKNLIEDVPFAEWYLGTYSNISTMDIYEKGPALFT